MVSLQSYEHFDLIPVVDKNISPFLFKFLRKKLRVRVRETQIIAPTHHCHAIYSHPP